MAFINIEELPLQNKKVLLRVDFNVPQDENGNITDDTRIRAALPTIQYLLNKNASVILMSHLGRPKGKKEEKYSLKPVAEHLSQLLNQNVIMAPDCVGEAVTSLAAHLKPKELLLLENLRFYVAEEKPESDPSFAKSLASFADFYIDDAFGAAHRAHSSITEVTKYFKGKSAPGFLMQKEIEFLGNTLKKPQRPFYAIIGGAKISSKLGVLKALLSKVDALFIGGGMSYTFMKAQGYSIGNSIYEEELIPQAKEILNNAAMKSVALYLPKDIIIAKECSQEAKTEVVEAHLGIPEGFEGLGIGPKTVESWKELLKQANTIFWNGPLGVFEVPQFAKGTNEIAQTLANLKATTIIGGGDSVAALQKLNLLNKISHASTGGGASLEYIEFGSLPGVEALNT